jgi:photosystem II stability/assembly factor-like uncharacterized protein
MNGLPSDVTEAASIVMDPSDSEVLYASTPAGVARTVDGGQNWTIVSTSVQPFCLATGPATPSMIYAGVDDVWRSIDAGATWTPMLTGFLPVRVQLLAVGRQPAMVYVGSPLLGVFSTTDAGRTWQQSTFKPAGFTALVADPLVSTTVYAVIPEGVYKSTDAGLHWQSANNGLEPYVVTSLAVDPVTTTTLYAGTSGHGVFRSPDGGASWSHVGGGGLSNQIIVRSAVDAFAIDPVVSSTIYAAFVQLDLSSPDDGVPHGVYKSTDGGGSWTLASAGLTNTRITDLAIDPADGRRLYASVYAVSYMVYSSTDAAATWSPLAAALRAMGPVVVDPGPPLALYLDHGVHVSTDGTTLTTTDPEAELSGLFTAFCLDTRSLLYVGTQEDGILMRSVQRDRDVHSLHPHHGTPKEIQPRH